MQQDYDNYSPDDFAVWQALFTRQAAQLPGRAHPLYLKCVGDVGFTASAIPRFTEVNEVLASCTGFEVVTVPGWIPEREFFSLLAQRRFPATTWLRSRANLDYTPEPDMFHDVYGHVPMLAVPAMADFLEGLARIALPHAQNPLIIELMARIYWFTVEFGLIQTVEGLRIYGAGILSSGGESAYCLSEVPARAPFDIQQIMATAFYKDRMQTLYFVLNSFEQLYHSLPEIERVVQVVTEVYNDARLQGLVERMATRAVLQLC